jgi:WXG100 family type VII secretion target
MGTKFSITGNAVNQHASNLDTSVAELNANLQQFLSSVQSLPGVWRGAAFQSFDSLQTRWQQATRDLNSALQDIQGRVGNSGQIYDAGHAEQQSNINKTNSSANWDAAKFRG